MDGDGELATIARETFEYGVIVWAGRKYEEWVRAWARPHPGDSRGLVQMPIEMYRAFQQRTPGERELARVRKELHEALGRCDWDRAHDLDAELRELETRVAATRLTALRPHSAIGG